MQAGENPESELSQLGSNPGRRDSFSSCEHLVSPTRHETTRTENVCARHDQDVYSYFFPVVRQYVK